MRQNKAYPNKHNGVGVARGGRYVDGYIGHLVGHMYGTIMRDVTWGRQNPGIHIMIYWKTLCDIAELVKLKFDKSAVPMLGWEFVQVEFYLNKQHLYKLLLVEVRHAFWWFKGRSKHIFLVSMIFGVTDGYRTLWVSIPFLFCFWEAKQRESTFFFSSWGLAASASRCLVEQNTT